MKKLSSLSCKKNFHLQKLIPGKNHASEVAKVSGGPGYQTSLNGLCLTTTLLFITILLTGFSAFGQSITGANSVCVGASTTLTASIGGGTWSSSNSAIAAVDAGTGVVTGAGAGTATISYSASGAVATSTLAVSSLPSPGTISGANAVCITSAITLASSVTGGIWSANNAIVTVGSVTGIVTGVAIGSDTVKYTVTNSCGSAYTAVNISINGVVGDVYTFAGTGSSGVMGSNGAAFQAAVNPRDLVTDNAGNVYFCQANTIMKVSVTGIISTVAGSSTAGNGGDGGPASSATLNLPNGVFVDNSENIFISCGGGAIVKKIDGSTGIISTIAGIYGSAGNSGDGGPATAALLRSPFGLCTDASGNIFLVDNTSHTVRRIDHSTGIITTVAGIGTAGYSGDGGPGTAAALSGPRDVKMDINGNLYITDAGNNVIRKYVPSTGLITTVAGIGTAGYSGDGGPATSGVLNTPARLAYDGANILYVSDQGNNIIRQINLATGIINKSAGTSTTGFSGDYGSALTCQFSAPAGIAVDHSGNFFVADANNRRIRIVPSKGSIASSVSGPTNICTGTPVTFSSIVSVAGSASYQWVKNGANIGSSVASYTEASPVNGDAFSLVVTISPACASSFNDTSNAFALTVDRPASAIVGTGTYECIGGTLALSDSAANGTWSTSSTSVATIGSTGLLSGVSVGTTTISYSVTNTCGTSNAVAVVTVNPLVTISATVGPNGSIAPTPPVTVCQGSSQIFTFTPSPGYHVASLSVNGAPLAPAASYTFTAVSGDQNIDNITFEPDCSAPAITACPANVTVNNDAGYCGAVVTYSAATASGTSPTISYSQNSGTSFSVGTTTVTVVVSNTCGSSTCSFTVTVNDNQNPTITAPAAVTVNANSGSCSATGYSLGTPTTADNCGVASVTNNDAGTYSVGTHTITWTVTDVNGNTTSATQNITVVDNQNPTITAPAAVTVNANAGSCSATGYSLGTPTTADNCGVASVTNNDAGTYSVGTHTITWTVTDVNGNTASATQNITVVDNQNPAITAPAAVTVNANAGSCSATGYSLGTPTTGDNCGVASVTNNDAGTYSVGTHTITWTVTDVNGNTASAVQNITVVDNQNPTITAPSAVTVNANAGSCSATGYSLGTPTTGDNCGVASVTNNDAGTYSVGTHTITWTVTDVNGNTASAVQNITVVDNQNPTITAPSAVTVNANAGSCSATGYSLGTPTTGDNCGVASVTNNDAGTYSVGTHTITWTVTDIHGNTASATQNITVVDNQNPTIIAPAAVTVNANTGSCSATGYSLGTPTTADNCGVASVANNDAGTYSVGTHTITWTVTDVHGNTASATQNITVVDNQNPTITAPSDLTVYTNSGCTATGVSVGTPVTSDNCSVASIANSHSSTTYSLGANVVTWSVTDGSGNTAAGIQTITVADNVNPTIAAPANITVNNDPGYCSATIIILGTPIVADNCSVSGVSNNHSSSTYPVGTTTVIWTVTDGSGNTATATQTVTVNDNQNPVITAPASLTISGWCRAVSLADAGASLGTPTTSDNCGVASVTNNAPATFALGTTTVTWTVTDIHGHTATATQNVTVGSGSLSVSATPANVSCNSANGGNHSNGSITTSVSGGTSAYTYAWSNGSTSANPSGLATGIYTVTVTDAHSCTASASATIGQPTAVSMTSITATNVSCNSTNGGNHGNGSIATSVTGGTGTYSYTWSGSASGANPSGLSTGAYSVTVSDGHSCTSTGSATVGQPTALTASATAANVSCNSANSGNHSNGSISTSVSGGASPYSYVWTGGATGANPGSLAANTYSVTVTDAHSCTASAAATVAQPAAITCAVSGSSSVLGATTNTFTGTSGLASYSWSLSGSGSSISGSSTSSSLNVASTCSATSYTVALSAGNSAGCSSSASKAVTVTESANFTVVSGLYSTGFGYNPSVSKSALPCALKVYDRGIVGARDFDQTHYGTVWNGTTGVIANAVISSPVCVNLGGGPVNQYTITVPANGHYLVVGQSSVSSSYYGYGGSNCTIYTGRRIGGHVSCDGYSNFYDDDDTSALTSCSTTPVRFCQVVQDWTGKCTEADTHEEFGSLMLVVTPVALTFDDSLAYLPVSYESVEGDWSVSVTADPPYGFYATPSTALSTSVTDSVISAVQFAVTDTGSEWTNTRLTHQIQHKGAGRTAYSMPGMINNRTNKPSKLNIVPNPANNNIKITMAEFEGKATVYIYNMLGQKVAEQPIDMLSGASVSMDISSLVPGVYLMTAENASGKASARLIKKGE